MSDHDPRLRALRSALGPSGQSPHPASGTDPAARAQRRQAAVSLVVRARPELDLLLIKRSESPSDPWSGHMAFPGGKRDDDDPSLLDTARRETLEETALDLLTVGTHLGRLGELAPSSVRIPPLTISSFVFGVPAETEASVASHEVERVMWVPIDHFLDPATHSSIEITFPDTTRAFPSFAVEGEHVWGLTHRILERFLRRYAAIGR